MEDNSDKATLLAIEVGKIRQKIEDHIDSRELTQIWADIAEIKTTQKEIKEQLTKYKGFLGGVVFVFSVLWAGALFVRSAIVKAIFP